MQKVLVDHGLGRRSQRVARTAAIAAATTGLITEAAAYNRLFGFCDWAARPGDLGRGLSPCARAGRSDVEQADTATVYVERCVNGGEKVGAVARSLAIEPTTFSTQIRTARRQGFLTGNPPREQVDGSLTDKGRTVTLVHRRSDKLGDKACERMVSVDATHSRPRHRQRSVELRTS